jgi:hypothetical protein
VDLASLGANAPPDPGWRSRLAAMAPDPEGAMGYGDVAGPSREAQAAAGLVTGPLAALGYFGRTLRGEEPLYDVEGHPLDKAYGAAGALAGLGIGRSVVPGRAPVAALPMAVEEAVNPMTPASPAIITPASSFRGYHASPYDFPRFDIRNVGRGEGHQGEGHGLYYAGHPNVMEAYYNQFMYHPHLTEQNSALLKKLSAETSAGEIPPYAELKKALEFERVKPTRYEVDIHADPQRFLDWDNPLSGQNATIRNAVGDVARTYGIEPDKTLTGREIYRTLQEVARPPRPPDALPGGYRPRDAVAASRVSQSLLDAGIPGNKYLDAFSRTQGEGTRNSVVFDDRIVEILRKYGLLGPVAGGAAAAAMPDNAPQ